MNMSDFFEEEEERMLAQTRAEIAAEKAEYDALSPIEKAVRQASADDFWAAFEAACQQSDADDEAEDDEEDDEPF